MSAQRWGEDGSRDDYELRVFCNLIMTHWRTLWRIGDINEETLERLAAKFFRSEVGRVYWSNVGPRWIQRPGKRDQRFMHIVSDQLERTLASGPPLIHLQNRKGIEPNRSPTNRVKGSVAFTAGAIALTAVGVVFHNWRSRRQW
jgi:hypothetical protein